MLDQPVKSANQFLIEGFLYAECGALTEANKIWRYGFDHSSKH